MVEFVMEHGGTVLVGGLLAGAVALILRRIIRSLKQGKNPACGCGCEECRKDSA
ncbi:MAG: FeoB-associated Cys-rich membrane protein [Desulfovibrio sp.]|jgi:hypothetical protein|nr:FeoB-associated Cys-rich membrane protein [Desulfovibrio sp.]